MNNIYWVPICAGTILSILHVVTYLILSSNNHMYFKAWGMEKSTQSSSHKWKAWDYDFRFSAALTACSVSLQSPNILGVRMTVLICYCNPSSGRRYSSCQWQLDIRWTQGTTLKWEERIINDRWKKKWWKKCFWQNKCKRCLHI